MQVKHFTISEFVLQVEEVSKTEKLADASQVMEQKYTLCQEFVLSKLLTTLASPKLSFNLILEGIQPSMGSYYQVRCFVHD